MKKRFGLLLVIGTVVLSTSASVMPKDSSPPSAEISSACDSFGVVKPPVEKRAPSFCLKTLNGSQLFLDDFRGKPIMIKFWATWCPSCVEELPMMEKFSQRNQDQLVILMPAIDGEKESKVRRVVEKNKVTLPVLLDPKAKTARIYGVNMIPASFLINREGWIVGIVVGERDWGSPKAWLAVKELFNLR
ncbi:MAG: TlpA disulfide reductase family protein [Thermodesulfobacteriota bacterium]